jgi:hypothetical protein
MPAILFVPQSAKVACGSENLQAGCVKRRGRSCQLVDKTITHADVHHLIKAMPSILLAPCGVNPGAEAIFWITEAYDFLIDRSRASTRAASLRRAPFGARATKRSRATVATICASGYLITCHPLEENHPLLCNLEQSLGIANNGWALDACAFRCASDALYSLWR